MSKWFQDWEAEPVIRYTIDVPKPAGDGTVLENPSIKVRTQPPVEGGFADSLGSWFNSYTVLCASNWRIPWICESCHP